MDAAAWDRCRPWIEAALEYSGGTHTIDDIRKAIEARRMILLAGARSALVCEVVEYPRLRALNIFLAGGELNDVRSFDEHLVALARTLDCQRITISGRHGWERALRHLDYLPRWTVLAKEIT